MNSDLQYTRLDTFKLITKFLINLTWTILSDSPKECQYFDKLTIKISVDFDTSKHL